MYKELKNAIVSALCAGNNIMSIYNKPISDFNISYKADLSPITVADKMANETILRYLCNSDYPFISEESEILLYENRKNIEILWIIDPLDGTKEFISRNGEFTVNIALIKKGVPVLGVVYVPVTKELFFGMDNMGAYKINDIVYCEDLENVTIDYFVSIGMKLPIKKESDVYKIMMSRSHNNIMTLDYIAKREQELKNQGIEVECITRGSSLKIVQIAEGSANEYPRFSRTMEWDMAAAHAIARQVGVELLALETNLPLTYNKKNMENPFFVAKNDYFCKK